MELKNLITPRLDLPRLSKDLDETGHFGRIWSVHRWTGPDMALLWEAARGFRPLALGDLVPATTDPLETVVHHGKNSLPIATFFQKRLCRPSDAAADPTALVGFNVQPFSALTGPGYFVAESGPEAGEVVFDHRRTPGEKAASWPPIRSNARGVARLVFGGIVDVVRALSSHVTVGRVQRGGAWADSWFVLVRQEP